MLENTFREGQTPAARQPETRSPQTALNSASQNHKTSVKETILTITRNSETGKADMDPATSAAAHVACLYRQGNRRGVGSRPPSTSLPGDIPSWLMTPSQYNQWKALQANRFCWAKSTSTWHGRAFQVRVVEMEYGIVPRPAGVCVFPTVSPKFSRINDALSAISPTSSPPS